MSIRILSLAAAIAIIVAIPVLSEAQSVAYGTSSPVAITAFNVDTAYTSGEAGGELVVTPEVVASGITLKFINQSNVPATNVIFVVSDGRYTQRIVDKGIFSPGAQIKHDFPVGEAIGAFPHATCNVVQVDFADGSSWRVVVDRVAGR